MDRYHRRSHGELWLVAPTPAENAGPCTSHPAAPSHRASPRDHSVRPGGLRPHHRARDAAQIARVLDADVWRASKPGLDEEIDADRFGTWIEVLMQLDAAAAARTLQDLDLHLVVAGLARHVAVFDGAAAVALHDARWSAGIADTRRVPGNTPARSAVTRSSRGATVPGRPSSNCFRHWMLSSPNTSIG